MNGDSLATNRANSSGFVAYAFQALHVELPHHLGIRERLHISACRRDSSRDAPAGSHSPNQLIRL